MALRKVYETPANTADGTSRVVKVHYDTATEEYRARLYVDGKAQVDADYFDTEPDGVRSTADVMVMTAAQRALSYGEPATTTEVTQQIPVKRPRGFRCAPSALLGKLLARAA